MITEEVKEEPDVEMVKEEEEVPAKTITEDVTVSEQAMMPVCDCVSICFALEACDCAQVRGDSACTHIDPTIYLRVSLCAWLRIDKYIF